MKTYRETLLFLEGSLKGEKYTGDTNVEKEIGQDYRSCTTMQKYKVIGFKEITRG